MKTVASVLQLALLEARNQNHISMTPDEIKGKLEDEIRAEYDKNNKKRYCRVKKQCLPRRFYKRSDHKKRYCRVKKHCPPRRSYKRSAIIYQSESEHENSDLDFASWNSL